MSNHKQLVKQKKMYLYFMVLPLPLITVCGIMGLMAFFLVGSDSILYKVLNMVLSITTTAASILLLLLPLWIYRYIMVAGKLGKTS